MKLHHTCQPSRQIWGGDCKKTHKIAKKKIDRRVAGVAGKQTFGGRRPPDAGKLASMIAHQINYFLYSSPVYIYGACPESQWLRIN